MKCAYIGVLTMGCVVLSVAASSIAYDNHQYHHRDGFEPVATIDREALMQANDKEYLAKKTANLVDLFYETGFPKRIAKFARLTGALLENNTNDSTINEIFGKCQNMTGYCSRKGKCAVLWL